MRTRRLRNDSLVHALGNWNAKTHGIGVDILGTYTQLCEVAIFWGLGGLVKYTKKSHMLNRNLLVLFLARIRLELVVRNLKSKQQNFAKHHMLLTIEGNMGNH